MSSYNRFFLEMLRVTQLIGKINAAVYETQKFVVMFVRSH
jgi:hypothetical protein